MLSPAHRYPCPDSGSFPAELIGQYREGHPGIEVEIAEGTARDAVMQLRADRLDVAFVAGAPELPDCHTRLIWTETLMVALPDGHCLSGQSGNHLVRSDR